MSVQTGAVDHVEFHTDRLDRLFAHLSDGLGFRPGAPRRLGSGRVAVPLSQSSMRFLISLPDSDVPGGSRTCREWIDAHGEGVGNVALTTADVPAVLAAAVRAGARVLAHPARRLLADGTAPVSATVAGPGDLRHTLVQRSGPGGVSSRDLLLDLDHVAICVPAGELADTVALYTDALGFSVIFTERVEVGEQAMDSVVVRNPGGATFTLLEPDPAARPGQIDSFLDRHGGAGVQHLAFGTRDIVAAVDRLRERGVRFLKAPERYYDQLAERLPEITDEIDRLRPRDVLVDRDHWGHLLQLFTASETPNGALFYELVERRQARTFGSGNIRALYEAVQAAQGVESVR